MVLANGGLNFYGLRHFPLFGFVLIKLLLFKMNSLHLVFLKKHHQKQYLVIEHRTVSKSTIMSKLILA